MSHSVKNQAWQKGTSADAEKVEEPKPEPEGNESKEEGKPTSSLDTGAGVPTWTFKIEGKLLEPEHVPKPKRWPTPERKFSQLIKTLAVEMDRDPSVYADTNHVQWIHDARVSGYNQMGVSPTVPPSEPNPAAGTTTTGQAQTTPLDGFTITRTGDVATHLRITINPNHIPDRIKLTQQLATILGVQEDVKENVLGAFWNYVKANGLQDKNDRKLIRLDDRLRSVFTYTTLNFQDIQALIGGHLTSADPIVLHYEVGTHCLDTMGADVDMADPTAPAKPIPGGVGVNSDGQSSVKAFDIELELDDVWMRAKIGDTITSLQGDAVSHGVGGATQVFQGYLELQKADDEIKHNLQILRNLRARRDFFSELAAKPSTFIQNFVESQARDLEVILGNERAAEGGGAGGNAGGVRETDLADSRFFQGDWAPEAVAVHEGLRMSNAVTAMHHAQQMNMAGMQHGMPGMGGMPPPHGMPMMRPPP